MNEMRRLPRKYLIIYSRVFDLTQGRLLGYLADLSLGGAMIISENPLELDGMHQLRFDLPDLQLFEASRLDLNARVARCDPDVSPEFYNIGFEFRDLTPRQTRMLETMMDVYEFHREQPDYPVAPSLLDGTTKRLRRGRG